MLKFIKDFFAFCEEERAYAKRTKADFKACAKLKPELTNFIYNATRNSFSLAFSVEEKYRETVRLIGSPEFYIRYTRSLCLTEEIFELYLKTSPTKTLGILLFRSICVKRDKHPQNWQQDSFVFVNFSSMEVVLKILKTSFPHYVFSTTNYLSVRESLPEILEKRDAFLAEHSILRNPHV